ncbi:MAG TPA: putative metal-dependent hydrolase [Pyrinomonadaceae bacterium]|nr:putative metal-dependent hydrolase [Pyrinomonadaceae bacterium]
MNEDLRFPIGEFDKNIAVTPPIRDGFIKTILNLHDNLSRAISGLEENQLETPYRPEGWTVKQTVHHIADSHINAFIRFKLALTEAAPTIRPYLEDRWAELPDSRMPVDVSMQIIKGVHLRWAKILMEMSEEDFQRKLIHPDSGEWTLEKMLGLYDWHSRHHTAHITQLRAGNGW